ncbi:MAG TPA: exopolysaccharide biosynthesis polyprenyl glycosylphosphotransferase [Candidatus Saccharimonadales bacterium]|nr:exopolysaccharide biosynthesis polyprenyl glycosylphosphotransferase [Candidatus Saccharimonadales bacterium]
MKNNASLFYALLLIVGDCLALIAAFTAAYILRVKLDPRPLLEQIPALTYLRAFLTVLPLWILVHAFIGLYSNDIYEKRFIELGRLLIGSMLGILVVIGYDFVTKGGLFPARLVPAYGLGLGFGFLLLFRTLAGWFKESLYSFGFGISNVIVVGDTPVTVEVANSISNTVKTGQRVLGLVTSKAAGYKTFSSFEKATSSLRQPIHSIIQTELYHDQAKNNEILTYAQSHHAAYRFVPGNTDLFVGNIDVELFAGLPMIAIHQTALVGWGRIAKRLFDLVFGLILLIITSPIFLVVSVMLLLSGGHIFFRQKRLTRFNQQFEVYKFRTIKVAYNGLSPEKAFAKMGRLDLADTYRKNGDQLTDDPRFSIIGRLIRRASIDELPQLINVIKGDLSLVGPRALVPEELDVYVKKHAILSVKSGLTGLAQVSGRKDIDFDERRQLDVYYVQNWSFWLDLVILAKTLRVILRGS